MPAVDPNIAFIGNPDDVLVSIRSIPSLLGVFRNLMAMKGTIWGVFSKIQTIIKYYANILLYSAD